MGNFLRLILHAGQGLREMDSDGLSDPCMLHSLFLFCCMRVCVGLCLCVCVCVWFCFVGILNVFFEGQNDNNSANRDQKLSHGQKKSKSKKKNETKTKKSLK